MRIAQFPRISQLVWPPNLWDDKAYSSLNFVRFLNLIRQISSHNFYLQNARMNFVQLPFGWLQSHPTIFLPKMVTWSIRVWMRLINSALSYLISRLARATTWGRNPVTIYIFKFEHSDSAIYALVIAQLAHYAYTYCAILVETPIKTWLWPMSPSAGPIHGHSRNNAIVHALMVCNNSIS